MRLKRNILWLDVLILSCFAGLRWKTGTDWDQYFECFKTIRDSEMFHYYRYGNQYFESLYSFMNWGTKFIVGSDGYAFFLLWTSLLRYSLIAWTCNEISKYPILAFVGFISIDLGFPTARTAVAFALIIASYVFIIRRDIKKYLALVITAALIHKMCIIFLPVYWIYGKVRFNCVIGILLYSFSIAFSVVADNYLPDVGQFISLYAGDGDLQEKVETYTSGQTNEGALKSVSAYALSIFWIILFGIQKRRIEYDKDNEIRYDFLYTLYVVALCINSAFTLFFSDLTRFSIVFNTWSLLLCYTLAIFKKYQFLIYPFIVVFFCYRLYQFFNNMYFEDYYLPYTWIFDK